MAINGNTIYISSGTGTTALIAATKSNEIQTGCDKIEISSPNSGDWKDYLAGKKEWSFSVNWLISSRTDLRKLLYSGNTYDIGICGKVGNSASRILTGRALCTQAKITATRGNLCVGTFSFIGCGALALP